MLFLVIGACTSYESPFDNTINKSTESCPKNSVPVESRNTCKCTNEDYFFDEYIWQCRVQLYLPNITTSTPCVYPNCRVRCRGNAIRGEYEPDCEYCPAYTHNVNNICVPLPCRKDAISGEFEPNCRYCAGYQRIEYSPNGNICVPIPCSKNAIFGEFEPYCRYPEIPRCDIGLIGVPPNCCPPFTASMYRMNILKNIKIFY